MISVGPGPVSWAGVYFATVAATWILIAGSTQDTPLPNDTLFSKLSYFVFSKLSNFVNDKQTVLALVSLSWCVTMFISFVLSINARVEYGIAEMLGVCFPISTCLLYIGRHVITKATVKGLDYVTIVAVAGTLLAVAEFDTQSSKEKADVVAADVQSVGQSLQQTMDNLLQSCNKSDYAGNEIIDRNILSFLYFKELLFGSKSELEKAKRKNVCSYFRDFIGARVSDIKTDVLYRLSYISSSPIGWPDDTHDALVLFQKYVALRGEQELYSQTTWEGYLLMSSNWKVLSYLLAAFAFAVRLTRTTVEIFEWHDVPNQTKGN